MVSGSKKLRLMAYRTRRDCTKKITHNYISIKSFKKIELAWINVANFFFNSSSVFLFTFKLSYLNFKSTNGKKNINIFNQNK